MLPPATYVMIPEGDQKLCARDFYRHCYSMCCWIKVCKCDQHCSRLTHWSGMAFGMTVLVGERMCTHIIVVLWGHEMIFGYLIRDLEPRTQPILKTRTLNNDRQEY